MMSEKILFTYRDPLVREDKVPNDDLNFVKTGGQFGKKRRFPTFLVKKEGNKYNAYEYNSYDKQNKMSLTAGANSLEWLAKMLKPFIVQRTGSWEFKGDKWWLNYMF